MLLAAAAALGLALAQPSQAEAAPAQTGAAPSAAPASTSPAAAAPASSSSDAAAQSDGLPPGVPKDDYGLVAWCRGALAGFLDLKPEVMPEVTRIEGEFQFKGETLADDMKVYDELEKRGRADLALFEKAMADAEQASPQPIAAEGVEDMAKGRATWAGAGTLSKARLAQDWMSWEPPPQCETAAKRLEAKSTLFGQVLKSSDAAAPIGPQTEPPPASPQ